MIHQKGKGSPNFEVIWKGLVMNMAENIWPEGKKCAFCLGFDMDSNLIWFNKIKDMENGMQFIKGPSVGEYGPKRGVDRIMNLLEKYGVKATFFIPAINMERNVPLVERILDNGHEIAHHGLYHEPSYGDTVEEQLEIIDKSQEIFKRIIGKPAAGFRCTGGLCEEAEEVLYNDPNTLYTCQGESSELPVFMEVKGKKTHTVRISCRQEVDDYIQMVYNAYPPIPAGLPRISAYEDVLSNFKDEVDGTLRFGGVLSTAFHPQVSGSPGKSKILDQLLAYITSKPEIWCTSCEEVASYWQKKGGAANV